MDDIAKKIDAKIAELEEQERLEAASKESTKELIDAEVSSNDDSTLYENGTYSDDFFNDFFSDDLDN